MKTAVLHFLLMPIICMIVPFLFVAWAAFNSLQYVLEKMFEVLE